MTAFSRSGPRRFRAPFAALALALLAAACDGGGAVLPRPPAPPPETPALAVLRCSAGVRERTLSCADAGAPPGVRAYVFGGQGKNVLLASSGVAYDPGTRVFAADVTLQNLLVQRMGSDGATHSGIKVGFTWGPVVTDGTGEVTVDDPHGFDFFTDPDQPYFFFDEELPHLGVTTAQRWRWNVPGTVNRFEFLVVVQTHLVDVVVFDALVSGNRDIYRVGIDGRDVARLTTNLGDDRDATVAQNTVVFTSFRDGNAELYSMPLAGGAETRLTTTADQETGAALSPDGTRLAYVRAPGAIGRVWTAAADGSGAAAATTAFAGSDDIETGPAWASSSRLAFVSTHNGSTDLWQLTVGGTPAFLTGVATASDITPAWSPDGTKVAFASNRTGDTELYLLDVASGSVTRLTTRTGSDATPTWLSSDRLVYSCTQPAGARTCWMDPANPATATMIATPAAAERPHAVRLVLSP